MGRSGVILDYSFLRFFLRAPPAVTQQQHALEKFIWAVKDTDAENSLSLSLSASLLFSLILRG